MGWAFFSDSNIGLFGLGASWEANTVSGSNLYNKKAMEGHELKQTAGWEKTPQFRCVQCSMHASSGCQLVRISEFSKWRCISVRLQPWRDFSPMIPTFFEFCGLPREIFEIPSC